MGKVVVRTSEGETEWENAEDYINYCNTLLEADMNINGYTGEEFIIDLDGCDEDCVACQEIELDEQEEEGYDGGERYALILTEDEAYTLQVLLGVVNGDKQCSSVFEKLLELTDYEPECEDYNRLEFNCIGTGEQDYEITFGKKVYT